MPKGESTLNLSVLLKDPAQVTAPPQTWRTAWIVVQVPGRQSGDPVDMATEFMTKIAGLEGYQAGRCRQACRSAGQRPGGDGPDVPALPPWKITPSAVCSTRTAR
ncbi:hypothetical protein LNQ52_26370 [Klebsiella pneumoniae subsp. pneumoniae]|nr:hypothetical protein [Klebsiella pneumoniae subsp. pneumoniae]